MVWVEAGSGTGSRIYFETVAEARKAAAAILHGVDSNPHAHSWYHRSIGVRIYPSKTSRTEQASVRYYGNTSRLVYVSYGKSGASARSMNKEGRLL